MSIPPIIVKTIPQIYDEADIPNTRKKSIGTQVQVADEAFNMISNFMSNPPDSKDLTETERNIHKQMFNQLAHFIVETYKRAGITEQRQDELDIILC